MNIVYDCRIPEVMGYAERAYCFLRGNDAFLIWDGYFQDLMRAMWTVYGWEPDSERPEEPSLNQVPLLRDWNESASLASDRPVEILNVEATARAFRAAAQALNRNSPNLADSPAHGLALADFLGSAAATGQVVRIAELW